MLSVCSFYVIPHKRYILDSQNTSAKTSISNALTWMTILWIPWRLAINKCVTSCKLTYTIKGFIVNKYWERRLKMELGDVRYRGMAGFYWLRLQFVGRLLWTWKLMFISIKTRNILTGWVAISFYRRTLLLGVNKCEELAATSLRCW
jgi:hypothetical protein